MALVSNTGSALSTITGTSSLSTSTQKTANVTRSLTGSKDNLATGIDSIVSVKQDTTTYVENTDFSLNTNKTVIAWGVDATGKALPNAKIPTAGSTYVVTYSTTTSIPLGTFSASVSDSASDNVYVSLSLKGASTISPNRAAFTSDLNDYVKIVLDKLDEVANKK